MVPPVSSSHAGRPRFRLSGYRLSAAVFLLLMGLTNLGAALLPARYDAHFRMPRGTVRGWEQVVAEAQEWKAQGNASVVVLGDSIGWGYSSRRPRQTLAWGLQEEWTANGPRLSNGSVKVFNLSCIAAAAPDQYALLLRALPAADLVALQVYVGHYGEEYLGGLGTLIYPELAEGLPPADPLARELAASVPEEHYPQRILGGVEEPLSRAARALSPLAAKKDYLLSLSGLDLTDPDHLLKSFSGSSAYLPFPSLSPEVKAKIRATYAEELRLSDGPKTRTALRYLNGLMERARTAGVPLAVVVTPVCPELRDLVQGNERYERRAEQIRRMAEASGAMWLDYSRTDLPGIVSEDFHDLDHLIGEANIRLGRIIARDIARLMEDRSISPSSKAAPLSEAGE